jgi:hypothetical protein
MLPALMTTTCRRRLSETGSGRFGGYRREVLIFCNLYLACEMGLILNCVL